MAAQQRVQDYLQRHKIGPLFEELMAKVIDRLPEEPVPFIVRILQRKAGLSESEDFSQVRRSTGEQDGLAVAKDQSHDRPWKTNSKRLKPKKSKDLENTRPVPTRSSKDDWDHTTKLKSQNFDELFTETQGRRSPTKRDAQSPTKTWKTGSEDHDFTYQSSGYSGPRRNRVNEEDALASELIVPASNTRAREEDTTPTGPSTAGSKKKGQAVDAARHRKKLGEMVLADQAAHDSGFSDNVDEHDDALEVLESAEDLASEGVANVKSSGVRMAKSRSRPLEDKVKVSICATCAKIMGGGAARPSEPVEGMGYGELPDYDYETDRDFPSRPQTGQSSARYTPSEDEEFESVSQVTGPRKPVWHHEDSDAEILTPRKGSHMFVKSATPPTKRGQPMYASVGSSALPRHSSGTPTRTKNPGRVQLPKEDSLGATLPARPDDTRSSYSHAELESPGAGQLNKTWSPGVNTLESEDDRNMSSPDILSKKTRGWQVPADDSDTSTVDWDREGKITGLRRHKTKAAANKQPTSGYGPY